MFDLLTPLLKQYAGTALRHGLTIGGTYLTVNGLASPDQANQLVDVATGIGMNAVGIGWSLAQKYMATTKLNSVLQSVQGTAAKQG